LGSTKGGNSGPRKFSFWKFRPLYCMMHPHAK
jgi:hypothetical protein